jgi:DNA recombination protein Rad52
MSFTSEQRKQLAARLNGRMVRERTQNGQVLAYIEGWFAIAEANRIFGFDGWDRETISVRCVWEGVRQGRYSCVYLAQVRIRVRAGETMVTRDGHGAGSGAGTTPAEAQELAIKEAETDATKRALVTFGNAFGLCLYDREQKGLRRARRNPQKMEASPIKWVLQSISGEPAQECQDPAEFCSALRRAIEACTDRNTLQRLWQLHASTLALMTTHLPQLRRDQGQHFASILTSLYRNRVQKLQSKEGTSPPIQANLALHRRVRDKAHLHAVAKEPCLVCGRSPSQAHHLKFLEPRGLGLKPSDEFAVPLCRLHHRSLHDAGDEQMWWRQHNVEPVGESRRLWEKNKSMNQEGEQQR